MKIYSKVTQEANGQLFARYQSVDHNWDVCLDYDVITEYTIYEVNTWSFAIENINTNHVLWVYSLDQALDTLLSRIKTKVEANEKIEKARQQFEAITTKNSLDERYKDVNPEKKVLSNEELRKKYAPYQNFNSNLQKFRVARQKTASRLNADYYDRLINH